jgi:GT2 family glycosyltransferase
MIGISIVIVNYKSWYHLSKCLDSILNQKNIQSDIIVVDNNSNDNSIDEFKTKYSTVKWIINSENLGFSRACNIGASNVKYDWILFLNPDTEIPENCFSSLMSKANKIYNTIYSIKQLNEKNKDSYAYGTFLNIYTLNGIQRFFYRLFNGKTKNKLSRLTSFSPDWVSGSFLLIRKEDYIKIGGWDEDFWMYYEDMDMCKRAKSFKINTIFYNDLYCYHFHGKSSRKDFKTKIESKVQVIKSSLTYINKHYNGVQAKILSFSILFSVFIELIIMYPFSKEKRNILKKFLKT